MKWSRGNDATAAVVEGGHTTERDVTRELQRVERAASELMAANQRLAELGRPDCQFFVVRSGAAGLEHWKQFLATNMGLRW